MVSNGGFGPSAPWAVRRLTVWLEAEPDGYQVPLGPLAGEVGLGAGNGRNSLLVRSLSRLVLFDLARTGSGGLCVRRAVPPLAQRHLARLPDHLVATHHTLTAAGPLP